MLRDWWMAHRFEFVLSFGMILLVGIFCVFLFVRDWFRRRQSKEENSNEM
jgi:hypothetical protein